MDKKTILVIDDSPEVTKILKFHLQEKYTVIEAGDGQDGLEKIYKFHPHLVIMDINMPKMDGIALYNKISVAAGKPDFPVIILTVREELGRLFKDMDVDGFVTKPFEVKQVLQEIETIISRRYGLIEAEGAKKPKGPVKVLIVENDPGAFSKIAVEFLTAGYLVSSAAGGMAAIEKIMSELPDLIVIKLGLPDITGELVCIKLRQMPRTMDIPFVLYTPKPDDLDRAVVNRYCSIIKAQLISSEEPGALLNEAKRVLEERDKGK